MAEEEILKESQEFAKDVRDEEQGSNDPGIPVNFKSPGIVDPKLEKRALLKIDCTVGVLMAAVSCLLYMDKVSNSVSSLLGFQEDLNLKEGQYSWVGSVFYFGFLAFQLFGGNLFFHHLNVGLSSGICIVIWGVIVTCLGASHNFSQVIAMRFLQGLFEGCVMPTFVFITSQYYVPHEHYSRTNFWYGSVAVGQLLIDCLAYGLYTRESTPYTPWRLVFIILGSTTIGVGLIYLVFITNPIKAWWLTPDEKAAVVSRNRYAQNMVTETKWYQLREAFVDPQTYIMAVLVVFLALPNGGITNYNAIIINDLGYSTAKSYLMDMPAFAVEFSVQLTLYFISSRLFPHRRVYYAIFFGCLNVLSLFLLAYGPDRVSLAGYYLWSAAFPICYVLVLSCVSSNVKGSTKQSVVSSVVVIAYSVGGLAGPQAFKDSEKPQYHTAKTVMSASSIISIFFIFVLFAYYIWENKRRDTKNEKLAESVDDIDLTDGENPEFRYAL